MVLEPTEELIFMWPVIVILLIIWAVLSVVGFALKGLLWLGAIGVVLFLGTIVFGVVKQRTSRP